MLLEEEVVSSLPRPSSAMVEFIYINHSPKAPTNYEPLQ